MDLTHTLVLTIIALALAFDYVNGFHDAANSIATVVATRVLSPGRAVAWAAFFNFIAAFGFGTAVASTVGTGLIQKAVVNEHVILGGLVGAIAWDLITWFFGIPSSSSHALVGGYAGAAMARVAIEQGWTRIGSALIASGWIKTLAAIVISPVIGMIVASILIFLVTWGFRSGQPRTLDRYFRRFQLFSAAIFSFAHGTNDAQKTMGIIASALFAAGYIKEFYIPSWVILAAYAAIGLGTFTGGWRIVRTMGTRLTKLRPMGGFCAETAAAITILTQAHFGGLVSTTHTITGAIVGVGTVHRVRAVRWGLATSIVWAWLLTIPASAAIAALSYWLIRIFLPAR
ncbi:MAG: inorganic phosphate transporter [Acidobacteria bacterium]|nr:inorganic phosphate transporter [Acidobacteriota bacterium]